MRRALALLLLAAPAIAAAAPAAAQVADRYGYAPPDAQIPMRQSMSAPTAPALRTAPAPAPLVAPALRTSAAAAPPLRLLSWAGKSAPVVAAPALQPLETPRAAPRAVAPPAPAGWTPRRRWSAPAAAPTAATFVPSATAGVGPGPRPTFVAPPGVIARAPAPAPAAVAAAPAPQGVAALGPPRNPWYQRWPEAAAVPDPGLAAGVGASLAPGTPAAPPPVAPLAGYAAPAAGAAPLRTASAAPAQVTTAKYYSVHTAYGHAPDPAPIPPQFFGPTADLSAPETPDPPRATLTADATSAKAAVNAARLQQSATD